MTSCARGHALVGGSCPTCLLEPTRLDGTYELGDELGKGGAGVVYRARDHRLSRDVAIKLLDASSADAKARIEREARALARISHPNIVAIYDVGEDEGAPYLVMELAQGKPLAGLVPLSLDRALHIVMQVCEAVGAAHAQGLVHRDLSPNNVLVTDGDTVKVLDFGIARSFGDEPGWTLTAPHLVAGTPHYVAPEVLRKAAPDPRADVYSLGVLLYHAVLGTPVGPLAALPSALQPIVGRALALDPSARHRDAAELLAELSRVDVSGERLPMHERYWVRAAALVHTVATALVLWAMLAALTPKVLAPGQAEPLIMLDAQRLPDGRILSHARFETWPTLLALLGLAMAFVVYALLRRHWWKSGLLVVQPDVPVHLSRWVLGLGALQAVGFGVRLSLEALGYAWPRTYSPVLGGLSEVALVYLGWLCAFEAERRGRSLVAEWRLWVGVGLGLVPPVVEFGRYLFSFAP